MTRTAPFSPDSVGPCGRSRRGNRYEAYGARKSLITEWYAMKKEYRISEREHQDRLQSVLKNGFNTQLQPLRSLKTVTKKRRALKEKATENFGLSKSSTTSSG
jgi:hypothetical protein